jgi:hypothetical protein
MASNLSYCLENVERCERMASTIRDAGLRANYVESANHWRRLAEKIKQLEKGGSEQLGRSIADMARDIYPSPSSSILENPGAPVSQIIQMREDDGKPDNAADHQEASDTR